MTDITKKKLRSIGFKEKRYQGKSELCLDLPEALASASDRQWIEVGPASCSHGYFSLMRWVNQENDQQPPDMFEIKIKDFEHLCNLLKLLGASF